MVLLLCTGQGRALFFMSDHFYRRGGFGEHAYGLNCASMLLMLLLPLFSVVVHTVLAGVFFCFFTVFTIWGFFRHCLICRRALSF